MVGTLVTGGVLSVRGSMSSTGWKKSVFASRKSMSLSMSDESLSLLFSVETWAFSVKLESFLARWAAGVSVGWTVGVVAGVVV